MNKGCLLGLAVILLLITAGLFAYFNQQSDKENEGIKTTKPTIEDVVKKTVATGSIKPRKEIMIKPQVSGVVDQLFVEAGQLVTKGQKLARIKLIPDQVSINNAQSSVELARIRMEDARRELNRQRKVFDQQLDVEAARTSYEDAKAEEGRQRNLFDDGIISETEYNQFKLRLNLQKAAYENANITATNSIQQLEADLDIRTQEYAAAQDNLALLREGATRNSKQVSNVVLSTVAGMVLDVPIEEGASVIERNNFNEGTTIASVADMKSLIFEGMVDESDVGKLKEGMPLELTVGAIESEKFSAKLEYISPKGVEEEGAVKFEVKAAIEPTSKSFLRAGYSASGDIILDRRDKVVVIQERDLIFKKDSTFVEVQTGENEFEKRLIKTGLSDGLKVEVMEMDTTMVIKVQ